MARLAKYLAAAILGAGALSASACVEDEGMFYIAVTGTIDDEGVGDCGEIFDAAPGVFEVLHPGPDRSFIPNPDPTQEDNFVTVSNRVVLCVINKMHSNTANGVETSNIILTEFEISFSEGGSRTEAVIGALSADSADGSPGLDTANGTPILVPIFDQAQAAQYFSLAASSGSGTFQTVAGVRLRGRTTGGLDVDTPEYFFPVQVTTGYFCSCDADAQSALRCFDEECS